MKQQTSAARRASRIPAVITHPIRNEAEYDAIVLEMDALFDRNPKPGSPGDERLNLLAMLVEAYDEIHYPVPEGTPQDAVLFELDQQGLTRADLIPVLGSKSRVSEFLNGKRRLSLNQIDALRKMLKIPADVLMEKEPGFTYPAPAVRAAVVRERAPSGRELKVARIGNSRSVRLPAGTLEKYRIGASVMMEERVEGILLRAPGSSLQKLSWADTAAAMAASAEEWGEWDATLADGLENAPWHDARPRRVAEPGARYGSPRNGKRKPRRGK